MAEFRYIVTAQIQGSKVRPHDVAMEVWAADDAGARAKALDLLRKEGMGSTYAEQQQLVQILELTRIHVGGSRFLTGQERGKMPGILAPRSSALENVGCELTFAEAEAREYQREQDRRHVFFESEAEDGDETPVDSESDSDSDSDTDTTEASSDEDEDEDEDDDSDDDYAVLRPAKRRRHVIDLSEDSESESDGVTSL